MNRPDPTRAERGARFRERRRYGRLIVTIEVDPKTVRAFLGLGFIEDTEQRDKAAIAAAVTRFLAGADATAALGWALYPPSE